MIEKLLQRAWFATLTLSVAKFMGLPLQEVPWFAVWAPLLMGCACYAIAAVVAGHRDSDGGTDE